MNSLCKCNVLFHLKNSFYTQILRQLSYKLRWPRWHRSVYTEIPFLFGAGFHLVKMSTLILLVNVAIYRWQPVYLAAWFFVEGGMRRAEGVCYAFLIENGGSHVFILVLLPVYRLKMELSLCCGNTLYILFLPLFHEQDITRRNSCLVLGYMNVYVWTMTKIKFQDKLV